MFCSTAWSHPLIRVGGYPYAPFVVKESENRYRGLTLDLISALNEVQQEVRFVFVPTSATYRYQALALGRFSLMLFEDIRWNWDAEQVHMTPPLLLGGRNICRPQSART
ncbi:putative ABC transporter substrate-binding protein [Aeromonas salmonicida subsp. masoucida NBRC 13784]|nr:putative ABC transporter substrate-binding protein [Aeromonas salmonicida subsp. masoucida NBRC 13784]